MIRSFNDQERRIVDYFKKVWKASIISLIESRVGSSRGHYVARCIFDFWGSAAISDHIGVVILRLPPNLESTGQKQSSFNHTHASHQRKSIFSTWFPVSAPEGRSCGGPRAVDISRLRVASNHPRSKGNIHIASPHWRYRWGWSCFFGWYLDCCLTNRFGLVRPQISIHPYPSYQNHHELKIVQSVSNSASSFSESPGSMNDGVSMEL